MEFTGYYDNKNNKIYSGDLLKCKWGFSVKVTRLKNGKYVGLHLGLSTYTRKEHPYSLNCGNGYIRIQTP